MIELKEGLEFHIFGICRPFGRILLEHGHFQVEKIFKKTFRTKTISETGCSWCGNFRINRFQEEFQKKQRFTELDEAIKYVKGVAEQHIEKWMKDLEGYTPKHPDYKLFKYNLEVMKQYNKLLDKYTVEKHSKLMEKIHEGYNKFD